MTTERRVVIWTTPERQQAKEPWYINRYDRRDELARTITQDDIDRYLCSPARRSNKVRVPVQVQFANSQFLSGVIIHIERIGDLDFEASYTSGGATLPVLCFVADEVEWDEADRELAWSQIDPQAISRRIQQSRTYLRLSLAEFERRFAAIEIDQEQDEYERRNRIPNYQHWYAIRDALGVSTQWLIHGSPLTEAEWEMKSTPFR